MQSLINPMFGLVLLVIPAIVRAAGDTSVEDAVRKFARGGDQRDLEALEAVLDPGFRVVFATNDDPKVTVLSREQYLGLVRAGKIGGGVRTVKVESASVVGALAYVRVKMARSDASFDGAMTLAKGSAGWRVIEDATVMSTKANP